MCNSADHLASLYQTQCELLKTCEILRSHCDYCKFTLLGCGILYSGGFIHLTWWRQHVSQQYFMVPEGSLPHSKALKPVPVMSQIDPVHASPSSLLKIHFFTILPPTLRSSKWFLSLSSLHENPLRISPVSHTCYTPCQSFFLIWSPT